MRNADGSLHTFGERTAWAAAGVHGLKFRACITQELLRMRGRAKGNEGCKLKVPPDGAYLSNLRSVLKIMELCTS